MRYSLLLSIFIFTFLGCSKQYSGQEKNGYVLVEAENFTEQTETENRQWYKVSVKDGIPAIKNDPDQSHAATASAKNYLEALPDTRVTHDDELQRGVNFSNKPGQIAVLKYPIKFENPGKYYVWVRTFSTGSEDNGIHVGLNGTWPESGQKMQWCEGKNAWTWASKQRTKEEHCGIERLIYLDIPSAGVHTVSFSMREDGFEFDAFVLSKDYINPDDRP